MTTVTTITDRGVIFELRQFFSAGATQGNGTYRAADGDTLVFYGDGETYTSAGYFTRVGGQSVLTARLSGFSIPVDDIDTAENAAAAYRLLGDISFRGGDGDDYALLSSGDDTTLGGAGRDIIYDLGFNDEDRLSGGAGNDVLGVADGTDVIDGGAGIDQLVLSEIRYAGATVDLNVAGFQTISSNPQTGADGLRARLISIEDVVGTSGDDAIMGNGAANDLTGNGGRDTLAGGGRNDTLFGGDGDDRLSGGNGNDLVAGLRDDDVLDGGLGNDTLAGGDGFDTADYSAFASNTVRLASLGAQNVGQAGRDVLESIEGLIGGRGADHFVGDGIANTLDGGGGHDTLNGGTGDDSLIGRTGNDALFGGLGNDTLAGGDGVDVLDGGAGADALVGGAGADRFRFAAASEAQGDVIIDFFSAQGDRIDLRLIDASTLAGGDQAFAFIGASGFTGVAGQLRYQTTSPNPGTPVLVQGDTNGDAQADFQVTLLPGFPNPVAGDFLL